jgi:hypothetical protein
MYLIGAYPASVCLMGVSYGRVSHGRASHRYTLHGYDLIGISLVLPISRVALTEISTL